MAYTSACAKQYLEVVRAAGHLTVAHAAEIRDELRAQARMLRGSVMAGTGTKSEDGGGVLSELAHFAACLNDIVANAAADGHDDKAEEGLGGGGAVPVESSMRRLAAPLGGDDAASPSISTPAGFVHTSSCVAVLGDLALLHVIFDFVAEAAGACRKQIGDLALVCRQWRDLAHSEKFWRPIAVELFPRLTTAAVSDDTEDESDPSEVESERPEWYRRFVMQYGRCLVERPIRMGPWHEGITLSFDLHDEQDGLRLFSSAGPIRFTGTTIPGITAMKLTGRRRRVTVPFAAASRDPGGSFANIEELFTEGDQPDYPVSLCVRVTARDERTGKMALVFSSNKRSKRWVEPLGVEMGVPEGTLLVNQGWTRVTIPSTDLAMQMLTVFYVAPVENQDESIDPADRLYSVLTLDCAFMLQAKTEDQEAIGRFILAALDHGPSLEMDDGR